MRHKPQYGFTIIEIIVVISITMILAGLGMAGYNNFNQTQKLKQTAEDIKSALRDAQNRALTSEKDKTICSPGSSLYALDHWRFSVVDNNSYSISGSCGGLTFPVPVRTYDTPKNITLSPASGTIDFKPLGQGVAQGFISTITLTNAAVTDVSKNNINITISTSGDITVGAIY